jgi:hypothetical protein
MSRLPRTLALPGSIRMGEVVVLQGAPLLGLAFSIGSMTPAKLLASLIFAVASFFAGRSASFLKRT